MKLPASFLIMSVLMYTCAQKVEVPLPPTTTQLFQELTLAVEAIFGVGIRLQTFLKDDKSENFLVSPISAAVTIGELILGAEGQLRKQLVELLSLPNGHLYENEQIYHHNGRKNISYNVPYFTLHWQLSRLLKALESKPDISKHFRLRQKSVVFMDSGITLNDTFGRSMRSFYEVNLHFLDFQGDPWGAQKTINEWISKYTRGLIKEILAEPPKPSTSSIFANSIYFKANWDMPFSEIHNRKEFFNVSATKQVPVTYMVNFLEQIPYFESHNYRMIALPYTNEEIFMYLILPNPDSRDKYDIKRFVQNLSSREILKTLTKTERRDVVVRIPKMNLSHSFRILEQLKKYHSLTNRLQANSTDVVNQLDAQADAFTKSTPGNKKNIVLTKATLEGNFRVDDIVQQVVISVNEKGTEAAAVSATTIETMGGSKEFIIESPFVFFIRHEATEATLFWGTVSNPVP